VIRLALRMAAAVGGRLLPPAPQLELRLDPAAWQRRPPVPVGATVAALGEAELPELLSLLHRAGFDQFTERELRDALHQCLPGGCFGVRDSATGSLVATMMARHVADDAHPFGGRIDWLATDPSFTGRGLGLAAAAAATQRLVDAGYRMIWVTTDDHRPGAVRIFLKLGFAPVRGAAAMNARWDVVLARLDAQSARRDSNATRDAVRGDAETARP
jgi:GNAT superfamily N-acetyltransferase